MKKTIKIISDVLFITGLTVAGLFLVGHFTGKKPFSAYIVSSGSMEPAIHTGSVVVVSPKFSYQVGDVVTFYTGSDKKATTTHRIVGIDATVFKSAGDANNQPDMALIPNSQIIGQVRLSLPYLGYLAASAKTPRGFILLVIVPATIIVYEELKSLFLEIRKVFGKLRKNKAHAGVMRTGAQGEAGTDQAAEHLQSHAPNAQYQNPRNHFWAKPAIIFPIFFALLIPLTLSISYFIDRETSSGNSITATTGQTLFRSSGAEGLTAPGETDSALNSQFSILNSQLLIDPSPPTPTPTPTPELPGSDLILEISPTPTPTPLPEFPPLPTATPTPADDQIFPIVTPVPTEIPLPTETPAPTT